MNGTAGFPVVYGVPACTDRALAGNRSRSVQQRRDTAQTLVGDDLAALFGLDMEESEASAPSRSAAATSDSPRKKTRKGVSENLAVAAAPAVETKANAVTSAQEKKAGSEQGHRPTKTSTKARSAAAAQKNTMAPTRSATKKTVAAPTKSAAKPATAKPSAGIRKAQAKATVSARRRSDSVPVIAAPVPVSQFSSRRPVRSSAAPEPANSVKRRRHEGDG